MPENDGSFFYAHLNYTFTLSCCTARRPAAAAKIYLMTLDGFPFPIQWNTHVHLPNVFRIHGALKIQS